jgi:hypothetical protein
VATSTSNFYFFYFIFFLFFFLVVILATSSVHGEFSRCLHRSVPRALQIWINSKGRAYDTLLVQPVQSSNTTASSTKQQAVAYWEVTVYISGHPINLMGNMCVLAYPRRCLENDAQWNLYSRIRHSY